jgi:peptidoglycan/LPS O-acetylase OafA/YrhL
MIDPIQAQETFAEFKRRRARQISALLPLVPVFLALYWLQTHPDEELFGLATTVWAAVMGGIILGFIVFTLSNWRCPSCRGFLGKGISPRFCRQCGTQLQE